MASTRVFYLLIVDDDSLIHQSFRLCLPAHWKPVSATRADEIPDDRSFHAAFVDLHLSSPSHPDGLEILQKLHQQQPQAELIAMSGDLRRDLMEATLKAGAQRFLAKPLQSEELLLILGKIEALWDLRQSTSSRGRGPRWIGGGEASKKVLARLAALKGEAGPILLEGESGCGKEVAARLLHGQEESERPFIPVNIAALPENLFEAELFGHVKGAFTGADRDRPGLCEAAEGGDLFLDEIEALPLPQQVKLLRFLESGEIRRVGGRDPVRVHCRVIAASNQPLAQLVKDGRFREDLYFRLAGKSLNLPPLRERPEDIETLARHFLENERPRRNKSFTPDGIAALRRYAWPGNVRELKRLCEQLSLVSPLPLLREEDVGALLGAVAAAPAGTRAVDLSLGLTALVEDFEKNIIRRALGAEKDVEKAAALLKVSRSNLYKKIKDYRLETES
ncbi:MAG: sigma-54-dependent Fis family transcriptional regulator [Bdellovibrionaceae bacterium]|nr:sigma-54-dependent Fis family transcriptional regulator [Pseudobdellovibrionaceae bacterium]MBX3032361.1 sigma-54-dependent Fis family transcriptional regulator [Pseudobdellovibrionaceae bacterium]